MKQVGNLLTDDEMEKPIGGSSDVTNLSIRISRLKLPFC